MWFFIVSIQISKMTHQLACPGTLSRCCCQITLRKVLTFILRNGAYSSQVPHHVPRELPAHTVAFLQALLVWGLSAMLGQAFWFTITDC